LTNHSFAPKRIKKYHEAKQNCLEASTTGFFRTFQNILFRISSLRRTRIDNHVDEQLVYARVLRELRVKSCANHVALLNSDNHIAQLG